MMKSGERACRDLMLCSRRHCDCSRLGMSLISALRPSRRDPLRRRLPLASFEPPGLQRQRSSDPRSARSHVATSALLPVPRLHPCAVAACEVRCLWQDHAGGGALARTSSGITLLFEAGADLGASDAGRAGGTPAGGVSRIGVDGKHIGGPGFISLFHDAGWARRGLLGAAGKDASVFEAYTADLMAHGGDPGASPRFRWICPRPSGPVPQASVAGGAVLRPLPHHQAGQ